MGQSNDLENPDLILEKLKGIKLSEEENCNTLNISFHTINLILNDYKYFSNILTTQTIIPQKKLNNNNLQMKTPLEISKNDIEKLNNQYNKQIITNISHSIERIKK